jgi:ABC-type transport system involved in multi-copper enzyme maturation permease subunit
MQRLVGLIKREFFSYVNSPLAYVVIVSFLLISNFLFLRTALVLGDANLRPFIELLPWFLVVIAPALTMRLFSDEQRKGTFELLVAHPVSEWHVVVGKYLGTTLFYLLFLAATASLPITIALFSNADWGLIASQYLSALLVGMTFLAIGLAASTYVKQSVGSFLLGAAISFTFILIGLQFVVLMLPAPISQIMNELAIINHVNNISRGVLDLRDIAYFATVIGTALTAAVLKLSQRKFTDMPSEKRKLFIVLVLVMGVGVLANLLLYSQPIRLDATADKRFSVSSGTKELLSTLTDRVTITLYTSSNLPGPMQVTLRETTDRLKDFKRYGGDKVSVKTELVDTPQAQQEALSKGIRQVNFNQLGGNSIQIQQGNLGLEVRYGDKTEVIDFIEDAAQLEYNLSRLVVKLSRESQPKVGFLDVTAASELAQLNAFLSAQYEVTPLSNEADDSNNWAELAGVVVIDDGSGENATAAAQLKNYLANNGSAVIFSEGVSVDQQTLSAQVSQSQIKKTLQEWGITIGNNIAYDLQLAQPITLSDGGGRQYIVPYPFWFQSLVESKNLPTGGIMNNVAVGWPSTITVAADKQNAIKPILVTGVYSGKQEGSFTISPQEAAAIKQVDNESTTLAVAGKINNQRIAVIADADLLNDSFIQNAAENKSFVTNLIDWVAADPILSSIPQRESGRQVFTFVSPAQAQIVQWANIIVPPLVFIVAGVAWLKRRNKLAQRTYTI